MEDKEKIVWHYTKMETLEKIFKPIGSDGYDKDKITLRFTNIRFLNDPSEGLVFKDFFEKNKNEIANYILNDSLKEIISKIEINKDVLNLDDIYVFSASYLEDSFGFWNKEYAGLDGIAIGIKSFTLDDIGKAGKEAFEKVNKETYKEPFKDRIYFQDVIYTKGKAIDEILKNIQVEYTINKCIPKPIYKEEDIVNNMLKIFSRFYKQSSWKCEEESRIIENDKINGKIELNNNKIKKFLYKNYDRNVVSRIMLAPACNDEEVEAVKKYLDDNGYKGIPVSKSHAFDLKD